MIPKFSMNTRQRITTLVLVFVLLLLVASAKAQSGAGYSLPWFNLDGGGSSVIGGDYQSGSTIGRPEAGILTGEGYTLSGSFRGSLSPLWHIHLPLIIH